jgi:transaldolase
MTRLQELFVDHGQSPWLDNLTRRYLRDGTLARFVADGIRGVTANPTIFARAIEGSEDYDEQFHDLVTHGASVADAYWELVIADVRDACAVLRPTFHASGGTDGFVSIEVAPEVARDSAATATEVEELHRRVARPNAFVKIPATPEGIAAIRRSVSVGHNVNVTLVFSLMRYGQVIDAYLDGLETFVAAGGDPAQVRSVASFFVSRVDTEVDHRLDAVGSEEARHLRGRAAIAQAKLAYQLFRDRFSGERWEQLVQRGAHVQRPLWASTSAKDPTAPDTLYVDALIGPDTVTTLPEVTIAAFEHHGQAHRTLDLDVEEARDVLERLAAVGIDMGHVGSTLETNGISSFHQSFQGVLRALDTKARQLVGH